jgi:hypothetical protein
VDAIGARDARNTGKIGTDLIQLPQRSGFVEDVTVKKVESSQNRAQG